MNTNNSASRALPTFFRARIAEAHSSRHGYEGAGFHLAIHARQLVEGEVDDSVIGQLDEIIADRASAPERMWTWLQATLPRCMALVPARRKTTFLRGLQAAIDEDRV